MNTAGGASALFYASQAAMGCAASSSPSVHHYKSYHSASCQRVFMPQLHSALPNLHGGCPSRYPSHIARTHAGYWSQLCSPHPRHGLDGDGSGDGPRCRIRSAGWGNCTSPWLLVLTGVTLRDCCKRNPRCKRDPVGCCCTGHSGHSGASDSDCICASDSDCIWPWLPERGNGAAGGTESSRPWRHTSESILDWLDWSPPTSEPLSLRVSQPALTRPLTRPSASEPLSPCLPQPAPTRQPIRLSGLASLFAGWPGVWAHQPSQNFGHATRCRNTSACTRLLCSCTVAALARICGSRREIRPRGGAQYSLSHAPKKLHVISCVLNMLYLQCGQEPCCMLAHA